MPEKVILCWSGGKDSTQALYELAGDPGFQVAGLLATVTAEYRRLSLHGVRLELLERQAAALRLPWTPCSCPRTAATKNMTSRCAGPWKATWPRG